MTFVFALAFVLMVALATYWRNDGVFAALIIGLALGAWLTALIERRIRSITEEKAASSKPLDAVFAALGDIHWRLKRLEEAGGMKASPLEQANQTSSQTGPAVARPIIDETIPGLALAPQYATAELPESATAPPLPVATLPLNTSIPQKNTQASTPPDTQKNRANVDIPERFRRWLFGGNTVVRAGIVILFFGVAFLLKFAAEHAVFPLELRIAGVAAGAVALLVIGWRLRTRREDYALALQGAGVGLFYLTLFSTFRLYGLVPPFIALVAMVAVSGLSAALAVLQNSRALIAIAVTGGFLAPLLASTSSGNHVALFSYYAVLNLGIFTVAWFKAWRPLNLLGFFFTFSIGMAWGAKAYQAELFASSEAFLILFFLMFLAIAILFAHRQTPAPGARNSSAVAPPAPTRIVDSTLVFGLPLVAFGFQAELTQGMPFALAYSALALSGIYLLLARWLFVRRNNDLRLLVESFLALGVIFATLAIPLALDARWTSASWALEGAAVLCIGIRQQRRLARAFGLLLQLAAALAFFNQDSLLAPSALPLLNAECLGALLIALSALFCAWQMQLHEDKVAAWEKRLTLAVFVWGLAWWLMAGLNEANRWWVGGEMRSFALLFMAASAALFSRLQHRLNWAHARLPAVGLMAGLLLVFAGSAVDALLRAQQHPLGHSGWLAWPLALLIHFRLLHHYDDNLSPPWFAWFAWVHALGFWLLAALGAWELNWLAHYYGMTQDSWSAAAIVVVPGLLLFWASGKNAQTCWPLSRFAPSYLGWGAWPIVIALAAWWLLTDISNSGNMAPLPYLPLLNPVDLGHVFVLLVGSKWVLQTGNRAGQLPPLATAPYPLHFRIALAALVFIWLNAMLLRSIHHWANVPYTLHDMQDSVLVQTALSLFWSLLALTLMLAATRRAWRSVWMLGAALMAVVVGKLFLVDLSSIGSVARIVSFIGVGLLMLLIGYVAPVPPPQKEEQEA